jgi:hypothetical protein
MSRSGVPITQNELRIDFSDLLPGDILLFRPFSLKKHHKIISTATETPYTHAAVHLGNKQIVESTSPKVQIRKLSDVNKKNYVIAVLRSQCGFLKKREAALKHFASKLIEHGALTTGPAYTFKERKDQFLTQLLNNLERNYGTITSEDEFVKRSYLCSALVVACYTVTGIIGDTAQQAYQPNVFSPGDLHRDPTFGWLLGYIIKNRRIVLAATLSDSPCTSG